MTINRVQLALNVADLDTAVDFYGRLFGVEVHKRRPGYANFAIADPPLKLVLFEAPNAAQQLNHLGVEFVSTEEVAAAARTVRGCRLAARTSDSELCCHAVQDKVYVSAADVPLGQWEFYAIVDDDPTDVIDDVALCCADDGHDSGCSASVSPASTAAEPMISPRATSHAAAPLQGLAQRGAPR